MKFLYNHKTLDAQLSAWANSRGGPKKITKTRFYCWNSGSDMQMSRLGLLQTLLHHCLSGDTELCLRAFPERWKQFAAFGGGLETSWDWFELKRAFENIISDQSRSYFILIDGLDEFDGELKDIIKLVLGAVRPNVKMCVASRPWLPFEDAFQGRPNLLLQDLTQHDISTYVAETFRENEHYIRLQLDAPTEAEFLRQSIVEKALGVFLWVHLVVESLLEGLSNSDNLRDLQARHDALPSDLEALFENLLHSVDDRYYTQACQIFYMLRLHRESNAGQNRNYNTPSLLGMHFASDENLTSSITAPWETLEEHEACRKSEHMRRRLVSRCRGLLETSNPESNRPAFDHEIVYLHRTARDYIESRNYWPNVVRTASQGDFRAEQRWANANLWLYKVHPLFSPISGGWHYSLQKSKLDCASAIMSFPETESQLRKAYLDAMLLADPYLKFTSFEDSLKATLGLFNRVDGLEQCYREFYLAELTARASPEEREILNKHAGHPSINKANGRHDIVRHHGSNSFFRLTGYHKMRMGIKRLRQRTVD